MKNFIVKIWFFPLFFVPALAFAAVTVAPATGGSAIPSDTVGGAYTALTGPILSESNDGDIGNGTIILNIPTGFIFDVTGIAPTVKVTCLDHCGSDSININGVASGSSAAITSRTTTQITFTVTDDSDGNAENSLTWQNVRVRPTAVTPLASGNITKSGTSSLDSPSGTNYGTLTEIAAAASAIISASPASPIELPAAVTLTITINDSNGNPVVDGTIVIVTSSHGIISGSGTTVSGVVTRTLSASAAGTATLSIGSLSLSGDTSIIFQDTVAPVIAGHTDVAEEATSASGATVTYTDPTATDAVDGSVAVFCVPASGTTFAIGTTLVTCTATDSSDNAAIPVTFNVVVADTTSPALTSPSDVTMEAADGSGATVTYTDPTATDAVDGSVAVFCVPASGTTFAIGTTLVTCTATDSSDNAGNSSFNVIVGDTTAPVLVLPSSVAAEAEGASGAAVSFTASATDLVDGSVAVTCVPASLSIFAIGTTSVSCSAIDSVPNSSVGNFDVTVADTTAPSIATLPDITVISSVPAVAAFALPVAIDAVDADVSVACVPASGTTFAIGTTLVTCTATDDYENSSISSFSVMVANAPAPAISVPSGSYTSIQLVDITASGAVSIRYTANGTTPTCVSGTLYAGTVPVIASQTLQAIACYSGDVSSEVVSAAYSIDLQGIPADFGDFIQYGVFVPASESLITSTPSVTVTQNVTIRVTTALGTADVVISAGTVITAIDGSNIDGTALTGSDVAFSALSGLSASTVINGALQWGVPSIGLAFSPAITIRIPVSTSFNGEQLTIYRSVTGTSGWTGDGIAISTCVVSEGICEFPVTRASYFAATSSTATGSGSGGSSGSGTTTGGSVSASAPSAPAGQVLGASISCGAHIGSYLKMGAKNDIADVRKLQQFLNEQGFPVPVTGIYGQLTRRAVAAFQKAHRDEILMPWAPYGLNPNDGTGLVYKTTLRFINNFKCPSLALPLPSLAE